MRIITVFIISMMAALILVLLSVVLIFPDGEYSISASASRTIVPTIAFGLPLIPTLIVIKRFDWKIAGVLDAAKYGALGGSALSLGLILYFGIEFVNGRYDHDAARISVKVIRVIERTTDSPYILVVEDWKTSNSSTQLFWGPDYPTGWNDEGNCLLANFGHGALGFEWIGEQRIASCQSK